MTVKIRFPGDIDVPIRFFTVFTAKDLVRIAVPAVIGGALLGIPAAIVGGFAGAGLALYRPHGKPVDYHTYHLLRRTTAEKTNTDVPTTVQEVHGTYAELSDGRVAAVLEVHPTNLKMKHEDEQLALHALYKDLLHKISYPIEIHSRQFEFDISPYLDHIGKRTQHPVQQSYLDFCQDVAEETQYRTKHFVVLKADDPSEVGRRVVEVEQALTGGDLHASHVTGDVVGKLLEHQNPDRQTRYVEEYPDKLPLGWPVHLLQTDGYVDVIQRIEPVPDAKATKTLERAKERLTAEVATWLDAGRLGTNTLESRLGDVDWLLDKLSDRETRMYEYAAYVNSHSYDNSHASVENTLQSLRIDTHLPVFREDQSAATSLPAGRDKLGETFLLHGDAVAAGFPFATHSKQDYNGVLFGQDTSDCTPILMNRWSWDAGHIVRMGMTGSGKSYAAKLELIRSTIIHDKLQVYVVDPKGEYSGVIKALGGSVGLLDRDQPPADEDVMGFTVEKRGQEENVDRFIGTIDSLHSQINRDDTPTLIIVDEAHNLMDHDEGRTALSRLVREARDTNTAVTLISQNAADFTYCREGRAILDNAPCKIFMKHDRVPDSVVGYFNLSQRERVHLLSLHTGGQGYSEAIGQVSDRLDAKVRIRASDKEHELIKEAE